jgi:hypothetical protein
MNDTKTSLATVAGISSATRGIRPRNFESIPIIVHGNIVKTKAIKSEERIGLRKSVE